MEDVLILNALDKSVNVQAFGNWFEIKPKQIKRFRAEIGEFLAKEKGYLGIVSVPSSFEDLGYAQSEEGKAALSERIREGIQKRVDHLEWQKNNLLVSVQKDLDMANIKISPLAFASKGEKANLEELASYHSAAEKEEADKLAEMQKLVEQTNKKKA